MGPATPLRSAQDDKETGQNDKEEFAPPSSVILPEGQNPEASETSVANKVHERSEFNVILREE